MINLPATEEGNNWTVVVFECPTADWKKVLVDLFDFFKKEEEVRIPHFTIRDFDHKGFQILKVSFRVLGNEDVEGRLGAFMKRRQLKFKINPEKDDPEFGGDLHGWIFKGERSNRWDRRRCVVLNRLSKVILYMALGDLFDFDSRLEIAHLAVNMLALKEAISLDRMAYYFDSITGNRGCIPSTIDLLLWNVRGQ